MPPTTPFFNPYARAARPLVHNVVNMGRQSQQRVSNTKRAFQLSTTNSYKKKKVSGQKDLFGGFAFQSEQHCPVCRAQAHNKQGGSIRVPKRKHHELCIKNTTTKGLGAVSEHMMNCNREAKELKSLYRAPLKYHEKASAVHLTIELNLLFKVV